MSKATVTQLLQQLEARLRVMRLNRTTRKVNVIADGAVYYERVIRLLVAMDDAETSLSASWRRQVTWRVWARMSASLANC